MSFRTGPRRLAQIGERSLLRTFYKRLPMSSNIWVILISMPSVFGHVLIEKEYAKDP